MGMHGQLDQLELRTTQKLVTQSHGIS